MSKVKEVEICKTQKKQNKDSLLSRKNVIGVGVGPKVSDGKLTGDISVNVYVSKKLDKKLLPDSDVIPKEIKYEDGAVKTDVIQLAPLRAQAFTQRLRPAVGGCSGAVDIPGLRYTGTLGLGMRGYGRDKNRYFILSNNHVLANQNRARIGTPVIQPGSLDGGTVEDDTIGRLFDYVPLKFSRLGVPNPLVNTVDAAVAELERFGDFSREIFWIGYPKGWRTRDSVENAVSAGKTTVQKTGRTTAYTQGQISDLAFDGWVGYDDGYAWFEDQLLITPGEFSDAGDSGSCILDLNEYIVGLLFAGSATHTIANYIEDVWFELPSVDFSDELFF